MFDLMLFDLDGTLTDPYPGITGCVKYALTKYGIEEKDERVLRSFIGPPLAKRFSAVYGFDEEKANEAVEFFRERFADIGIYENALYDGIPEALESLRKCGVTLAIATSKPETFAKRVLAHFDLAKYFDFVSGSTLDGKHVEKDAVIQTALAALPDYKRIIMIGDRSYDIVGAKKCGLASCGVRWGYADEGELEEAGADYIIEHPHELTRLLDPDLCKMHEMAR